MWCPYPLKSVPFISVNNHHFRIIIMSNLQLFTTGPSYPGGVDHGTLECYARVKLHLLMTRLRAAFRAVNNGNPKWRTSPWQMNIADEIVSDSDCLNHWNRLKDMH